MVVQFCLDGEKRRRAIEICFLNDQLQFKPTKPNNAAVIFKLKTSVRSACELFYRLAYLERKCLLGQ